MDTRDIVILAAAIAGIFLLTRNQASTGAAGTSDDLGASAAGSASSSAGFVADSLPTWAAKTTQTYVGAASTKPRVTADATSDEGASAAALYYGVPLSQVTEASIAVYNDMIEKRKARAAKS